MIYHIHEFDNETHVTRFESIDEFINCIEWQDIFEGKSIIANTKGETYKWDSSQQNEFAIVYGYTLMKTGEIYGNMTRVLSEAQKAKFPEEFVFPKLA